MKNKKLKDMTDAEIEVFSDAIKFDYFLKWAEDPDKEKTKAKAKEIEKRTGQKVGTPANLMIVSFFAGMNAGAAIIELLTAEEKQKVPAARQHCKDIAD